MIRKFWIAITLVLISSCSQPMQPFKINNEEASATILIYSKKLWYEHFLHLEDSVIFYDEQIRRVRLDFTTQQILTLCEARKLLVEVVDGLLDRLNGNAFLIGDHEGNPFSPNNVEIYITCTTFYNIYNDYNGIGLITLRNGISNFFSASTFNFDRDHWKKRSEFYWQSRLFVEYMEMGDDLYNPYVEEDDPTTISEEGFIPLSI